MIAAPGITVNGVKITSEQINAEVQYHPAESKQGAKYEAMKALVIRELLMQRAVDLKLCTHDASVANVDEVIEALFDKEINVPEADDETCQRFYDGNKGQFFTSPLFEVSHILYLAQPSDEEARKTALKAAQKALERIKKNPNSFAELAKAESACSSSGAGGNLGQIIKGQTTPAFEAALFEMQEGDLSDEPVASEFGYHLISVHKRLEGKQLPFDVVKGWIADHLSQQSWQRAFSQYVQLLAGQAEISGFQLKQADSPLVQ